MKTRRWDLVHKFEDNYRKKYLKKLTLEESFRIMEDLYKFGAMSNKGLADHKVTRDRVEFLVKERARFKKVAE